jgi:hypothetical protein
MSDSKGTPDRIRGDGGLGEAVEVEARVLFDREQDKKQEGDSMLRCAETWDDAPKWLRDHFREEAYAALAQQGETP